MKKKYAAIIIIFLLIGISFGSSSIVSNTTVSACKPHKIIKHRFSLVAGCSNCYLDHLRNTQNKPLKIDINHTGEPDLEGITIKLYNVKWNNHGYIKGELIEFPITIKPCKTFKFFICYSTDIKLKPGNYLIETSFNICETDNIPPTVKITKPKERSLYINNKWIRPFWFTKIIGGIDIEVEALDKSGINKVEFYIDNKLKSTDTVEPYSWTWDERAFYFHTIKVKAYDNMDNTNTDKINVFIFNR